MLESAIGPEVNIDKCQRAVGSLPIAQILLPSMGKVLTARMMNHCLNAECDKTRQALQGMEAEMLPGGKAPKISEPNSEEVCLVYT